MNVYPPLGGIRSMKFNHVTLTAKALLCIPLLAAPYVANAQNQAQQPDTNQQASPQTGANQPGTQVDPSSSKAVMLSGTITREGSELVLKDTSGTEYHLDSQDRAAQYEGKSVQVTGKLDTSSNTMHVDSIQPSGN